MEASDSDWSVWRLGRARAALNRALRAYFEARGYLEVETPALVATPGLEPHIDPFEVAFRPALGNGIARTAYLHTSPEYAMKRLLAQSGCPPLFQICKVFRNGELAAGHNPEFTMLEFYRPGADYTDIMVELEQALAAAEAAVAPGRELFSAVPYQRVSVADAFTNFARVEVGALPNSARAAGVRVADNATFEDAFFQVFLERIEPKLGADRPCFLYDYPASMASLARLKPGDASVAERVELYARGVELANGFSELTDAAEQRARLERENEVRRQLGKPSFPLDEAFLEAVSQMPPCAGIAVGLDRILALMLERNAVADVLFFPFVDH